VNLQVVASGVCPQGLSAGQRAPGTVNSIAIKAGGGAGEWQITVLDPLIAVGQCVLLVFCGSGSNTATGIDYGQSSQAGNVFLFDAYRNDTGAAIDVEAQYAVIRWPPIVA